MAARSKLLLPTVLGAALLLLLLPACDRVVRHKVLSTVFDGVPSLPDPEELCRDYRRERSEVEPGAETLAAGEDEGAGKVATAEHSSHEPYAQKDCQACHDFERGSGLRVAADRLCLTCHQDFVRGRFVHGPVSVGDCLACHRPHTSPHGSLLILDKGELCGRCHREARLTPGMHEAVAARQMSCPECHDPHQGSESYFLK